MADKLSPDQLEAFQAHLKDEPGAIAAIKVLIGLIQSSAGSRLTHPRRLARALGPDARPLPRHAATTIMGLQIELQAAADVLKQHEAEGISIASGCELFMRFVTRTALDYAEFSTCRAKILERGEFFKEHSTRARAKIAELGAPFIQDGATVLTTGYSRVVVALLLHAAQKLKKRFTVLLTESHVDGPGYALGGTLAAAGIPVTVIDDAAVAVGLERADMVLCGAEAVVENGGVISKVERARHATRCARGRRPELTRGRPPASPRRWARASSPSSRTPTVSPSTWRPRASSLRGNTHSTSETCSAAGRAARRSACRRQGARARAARCSRTSGLRATTPRQSTSTCSSPTWACSRPRRSATSSLSFTTDPTIWLYRPDDVTTRR